MDDRCATCGSSLNLYWFSMPLWDFGVRTYKERWHCERCIKAWKKGEL